MYIVWLATFLASPTIWYTQGAPLQWLGRSEEMDLLGAIGHMEGRIEPSLNERQHA